MGHILFGAALSGAPESKVLDIETPEHQDPKRRATFAFVHKVSRDPASVTKADVDSLRPYFKDAQIVELILAVCRYDTMNTLAEAFGSPLERENVFDPKSRKAPPNAPKAPEPAGAPATKP